MKSQNSGKASAPSSVLSHWYSFIDGVHFSSDEFYRSVEEKLVERKIPRLKSSRVEYHEGSVLSDKRVYLRLSRERFAFDLCAAPFGRGYFFSLRLVEKPRGGWAQFLACVGGAITILAVVSNFSSMNFVNMLVGVALVSLIFGVAIFWRAKAPAGGSDAQSTAADEIPDFDTAILNLPVIGEWYERIRADTYYRYDSRLLFHSIVSEIVKKEVEDVTAAKGVKFEAREYNPIFGELYATERKPDLKAVLQA